jgi:ribosomal protein S18 acetylase RimI-like enzyme
VNGALPSLRRAIADDEPFLRSLYREARLAEFASLPLSGAQLSALCDAQFDAQAAGYRGDYPEANHFVVCSGGDRVGRLITARDTQALLLVDLVLLPACRGRGWGSLLVRQLQEEARASAVPLRLHVEDGSPAATWYRKLGFTVCGHEGTHSCMTWTPA